MAPSQPFDIQTAIANLQSAAAVRASIQANMQTTQFRLTELEKAMGNAQIALQKATDDLVAAATAYDPNLALVSVSVTDVPPAPEPVVIVTP